MNNDEDTQVEFRRWAAAIKGQPGDPNLRAAQAALLDKALLALDEGRTDLSTAAELEAWAAMQEQHGTYPSMVSAMRSAAMALRSE